MKFSDEDAIGGLAQLEAVAALPDLMRNAKLVESYDDKKNNPSIKKMHRFQAALRIGTKDYSVKLTVKEFEDGKLRVDNHLLNSIATGWKRKCPLVTPTARGFPWLAGPQRALCPS